jgi:hypothetical protein
VTEAIYWEVFLHEKWHFFPGIGQLFDSTFLVSNIWSHEETTVPSTMTSLLEIEKMQASYLEMENARSAIDNLFISGFQLKNQIK